MNLGNTLKLTVKLTLLLGMAVLLSSCAVISKQECFDSDWASQGYKVGFDGDRNIEEAFAKRANICAKHGVEANFVDFQHGHESGIEEYCEIPNAVRLGARGEIKAINEQICPEFENPGFAEAFYDGYKLYELNSAANFEQQEIHRLESHKYRLERERYDIRRDARSGELSEQQQRSARSHRRYLQQEIYRLHDRINHLRSRVTRKAAIARQYAENLEIEYSDAFLD